MELDRPADRLIGVRRLVGWFVVALAAAVAMATSPAAASVGAVAGGSDGGDEPPPLQVEIDAGFDGFYVPGRAIPVRVTLTAPRLVDARLVVRAGGTTSEVVDVEVASGSSEEHWLLLDLPQADSLQVEVRVDVPGAASVVERQAIGHDRDVQVVGVLPGLAVGRTTDRLDLRLTDRELVLVDLPSAVLDLGPDALAALDGVAGTPDDLGGLSESHRTAVLGWLTSGGTLYVDGPAGPLAGWPDALVAPATHGLARIEATDGALAAGRWADVVLPAPNRSIAEDAEASQNLPYPDLFFEFSGVDLGRDLPPLSRLLAVLGVYVLVAGPLVYLASRRRVMLRWVAIPAVAGLFTAFLAITGEGLGDETAASVVDVVETGPGVAMATSRVLLSADTGGRELVAPAGWVAGHDDNFGFGQVAQRRRGDAVALALQVPPGGVGYVAARGPVAFAGGLEVEAFATDDGTVVGEVTNTTDVTLRDVAVFVGRAAHVLVGDVEPGATASFELGGADQFRFAARPFHDAWAGVGAGGGVGGGPITTMPAPLPDVPPGVEIVSETCDEFGNCEACDADGNCFGFGGGPQVVCDQFGNCFDSTNGCGSPDQCNQRLVRPETLTAALHGRGSNAMAPGVVTAVGWTDELAPILDLGAGVDVVERRTAVVGRAVPTVRGDRLYTSAVVRTLSRVGTDQNGNIEILFRFDLPAAVGDRPVDVARLRIDVPVIFTKVAILAPGGETVLRDHQFEDPPIVDRLDAPVPAPAVVDGRVFVRATLPFAPPQPGRELVLYEAAT